MAIVAAGMHFPFIYKLMIELMHLLYEESVHIRAKADGPVRTTAAQDSDDAGSTKAAVDLKTTFIELLGDYIRRPVFFVRRLRVLVDVAPDGLHSSRYPEICASRLSFRVSIIEVFAYYQPFTRSQRSVISPPSRTS